MRKLLIFALLFASLAVARAWELSGTKAVIAVTRDGLSIPLGSVTFTPQNQGATRFALQIDHQHFQDYFLSMKEFKCLQGAAEVACHVPYPYPNPNTVSEGDYAWLEHQLLFLYKLPRDFGAKLWNGVYYRLQRDSLGLVGVPQAVDLNLISAPPEIQDIPPYQSSQRDDLAEGTRWIARIVIQ